MTPRNQRMVAIFAVIIGVSLSVSLVLKALEENINHFYSPSDVVAGMPTPDKEFRLGGLVEEGSFIRTAGDLTANFIVTDLKTNVNVQYTGVLPDLFQEGQGMVARGKLSSDGIFIASEVLAKHDENYMSPEVKKILEEAGHPVDSPLPTKAYTD
ncbi:MAG: cytochrome c maturation protein CcmE [Pseudomonadota bacterium]|nr:cytochrome c maturation protein CcmE [Pseudomonadota bacterium]